MAESDKDGRIARWLREQHVILGMEMGESLRERTKEFDRILSAAADAVGLTLEHRTATGGQCDYAQAENGNPRPNTCPECPVVACLDCGGEDDRSCACWISLEGMALADIKGLLALGGLSVDL